MKKKYVIIPMALFVLGSAFVYVQAEEILDNDIQEEIILEDKEIIEIKHSLSGDYEVSFNYDKNGFINKIIIEKIQ